MNVRVKDIELGKAILAKEREQQIMLAKKAAEKYIWQHGLWRYCGLVPQVNEASLAKPHGVYYCANCWDYFVKPFRERDTRRSCNKPGCKKAAAEIPIPDAELLAFESQRDATAMRSAMKKKRIADKKLAETATRLQAEADWELKRKEWAEME